MSWSQKGGFILGALFLGCTLVGMIVQGRAFGPLGHGRDVHGQDEQGRNYVVEKVNDLIVYRVFADGFSDLTPQERVLAYWLSKAALAGRDLYYLQLTEWGLGIKRLLEGLLSQPEVLDPAFLKDLKYYAYRFWDASSNYDTRSYKKFLPRFSFEALLEAAKKAKDRGVDFGLPPGQDVEDFLGELRRPMFDPEFKPYLIHPNAKDVLLDSAVKFYEGVSEEEARKFYADTLGKHPLNSQLVKQNGELIERVWKVGGLYDAQIRQIVDSLKKALPWMEEAQREATERLIAYYQSGNPKEWRSFNELWARKPFKVDFINGFVEVYHDPLNLKGSFEGLVGYTNEGKLAIARKVLENIQAFEDAEPWKDEYKKKWTSLPAVNPIDIVAETGDAMPCCTIGINLPNEADIRERVGSKNFTLENVIEAMDLGSKQAYGKKVLQEFALKDEWADDEAYSDEADWLHTLYHEILGHGGGRVKIDRDPSEVLLETYNALEEARAELVALWQMANPLTLKLGLLPNDRAVLAHYRSFLRNALLLLRKYDGAEGVGEAHDRARHLISQYLIRNGFGVREIRVSGKTFYRLDDLSGARKGVGELLAEIQRIKAEGDYPAASKLIEDYAVHFDRGLRDEVVGRYKALDVPSYTVALRPIVIPVIDKGEVIDAKLYEPKDLAEENLIYSGLREPPTVTR